MAKMKWTRAMVFPGVSNENDKITNEWIFIARCWGGKYGGCKAIIIIIKWLKIIKVIESAWSLDAFERSLIK